MADDLTKYEQIAYDVRKKILSGLYKKNQQLPLERDMEIQYDVSRTTIKKAIDMLVQEGYVVKRRGAGTFVKEFNMDDLGDEATSPIQYRGFTEKHPDQAVSSDVLYFNIEQADEDIATKLNIKPREFVYHLVRVRKVNKAPVTFQRTFIPISLLMGLRFDNVVDSLYTFAEESGGVKIQSAHENISAVMPTEEEAKQLQIPQTLPLLQIESQVFLDTGQVFEYTISRYRSDKHTFHTVEMR
ncbi:GntR family transcriptional regulator [Lacticaseibacillus camelliae]|uniref:Transcriptional regulator, GntR family protein n=1 Tax=Lacticaseibacillus camelliae DSM 22697 = JCM 13995 TaxID=1423730 RepID=A0A0R2FH42_9LACO|nr:GntR family transcriptional regulator [Lacticaseibacillus camelliae]KRN25397.1 transcriptional regulator, GntR family protein [Lacticaseibacillus camelliae DSM 22697 = JCM 13995]